MLAAEFCTLAPSLSSERKPLCRNRWVASLWRQMSCGARLHHYRRPLSCADIILQVVMCATRECYAAQLR